MFRIITARRLAKLTASTGRTGAVQRRLARVKGERDQLLVDFDQRGLLAQEQAARLENGFGAQKLRADELATALAESIDESLVLTDKVGMLTHKVSVLNEAEKRQHEIIERFADEATQPVVVVVRDGIVHSVYRSKDAAKVAVEAVDPAIRRDRWYPGAGRPDEDWRTGWAMTQQPLPAPARSPYEIGPTEITVGKAEALRHLDQAVDDLQIHILRRDLTLRLLEEIDTTQMSPPTADQIRLACDALVRGGEVVQA